LSICDVVKRKEEASFVSAIVRTCEAFEWQPAVRCPDADCLQWS